MKKRTLIRIASLAMACTMLTGAVMSTAVTAVAKTSASSESAKEAAMKTALTKVKKRVSVPTHVSEFKYSVHNEISSNCFTFTWETPDTAKIRERIVVQIVGDIIISYRHNIYDDAETKQSFAKLTDEQLLSKAKEHLKQLNPEIYRDGVYSISNISLFGTNATVYFQRKVDGIAVDSNGASVSLDKDTGKLISCNIEWWDNAEFPSDDTKLTEAEAIESFKKLCTLTPAYTISYDYENDKQVARLVYRPDFTAEIDAFTGKKSTIWDDMHKEKGISYSPFGSFGAITEDAVAEEDCEEVTMEAGVNFTEAELKEIEADKSLLTKDKIKEMLVKDKYIKLDSNAELESSNLHKEEDTEEYFYMLYYKIDRDAEKLMGGYANIYLNAKTGEVEWFNKGDYYNEYDSTKAYPVEENLKTAKEVIKYFYGDISGGYKSHPDNKRPAEYWEVSEDGKVKNYEIERTYTFNRYVNDVIVEGDTIRVNIDNKGNINSISYNHTDVTFPTAPKFDKDKAFESLFRQQEMKLYYDGWYKPDGSVKTYLIYDTASFTLNRSYKLCRYDGSAITEKAETSTAYTDIKGNKYEKAITTLARYNITLDCENRKFNPDGEITDLEFSALVYKAMQNYVPYTINEAKKENKGVVLTRALAAKAFVTAAGGEEFAKLKGIYASPYSDVSAKHEYVGYIAIAKAMGLIDPTLKKYSPDSKVTRGEAMQFIYDYILRLS
ncbi:MAG: S-layer homology domain-containing protein [Oscillospiraceae bacterium]|nr:S-layer homology domain-containing protein [Oscillospiraceae bacterium]